ncbi:hypothetical protein HUA78_36325, partial [Myxococcus sp. CA033]
MRRLLALAIPLALMMGTGCYAHYHGPAARRPVVAVVDYRFSGDHPIPDHDGGGWCPYDHVHTHGYRPAETHYVYTDDVYYYQGPTMVWYWDFHLDPLGASCGLHGRHSHDYYPNAGRAYRWERNRGYVYDRTHAASAGYGYSRARSRPASRGSVSRNDDRPSNRPPPSGTGWGTQPPRGGSRYDGDNNGGGWGGGNNSGGNNGGGYGRGNSGRDRDDDRGGSRPGRGQGRDRDDDNNGGGWGSSGGGNNGGYGNNGGTPPGGSGSSGGSSGGGYGNSGGG